MRVVRNFLSNRWRAATVASLVTTAGIAFGAHQLLKNDIKWTHGPNGENVATYVDNPNYGREIVIATGIYGAGATAVIFACAAAVPRREEEAEAVAPPRSTRPPATPEEFIPDNAALA